MFDGLDELEEATRHPFGRTFYGRMGTPTIFTFEHAVEALYNDNSAPNTTVKAIATSSGLAAVTLALSTFAKTGKRILVADNVYAPTRRFCDDLAAKFGYEVAYYDPTEPIEPLLTPNTDIIFLESPGSLTMEVQDVPMVTALARRRKILTIMDNTWATALYFNPFAHGVDLVVEAATKYLVGHADAMLGVIICPKRMFKRLKTAVVAAGNSPGPEECYLGQRGLRTLHLRLPRHRDNALDLARWLKKQADVLRVYHPALGDCPGHKYFKRDFCGSGGLFSVLLRQRGRAALVRMVDEMKLFGLGYSWGGYESLILPSSAHQQRTVAKPLPEGQLVRLHAGLEDVTDLREDLAAGLERYKNG